MTIKKRKLFWHLPGGTMET